MALTNQPETLAAAARNLLWAIDGGYFSDEFLPHSAFVTAIRDAYERETGKSPWPREERRHQIEDTIPILGTSPTPVRVQ